MPKTTIKSGPVTIELNIEGLVRQTSGFNEHFRVAVRNGLEASKVEMKKIYKSYTTNRTVGINSKHISEMLDFEETVVAGKQRPKSITELRAFLNGDLAKSVVGGRMSKKWEDIAAIRNKGGIIRPVNKKLLTVPNLNEVRPGARATNFGNRAVWINLGGNAALIARRIKGKPKKVHKGGYANRVLFWGENSIKIKKTSFWDNTISDSENMLQSVFRVEIDKAINDWKAGTRYKE